MQRKRTLKDCPHCGRTFTTLGLPHHRARCKGTRGKEQSAPQPAPSEWPFSALTSGVPERVKGGDDAPAA